MIIIKSKVQSVVFQNYTKQEAERWLKKYHYKNFKEPIIYLNKDDYIESRKYEVRDAALFNTFYNKRINKNISYIMGYNS
jgi:hypothetical protein